MASRAPSSRGLRAPSTRGLRTPRLRLSRPRPAESVALDGREVRPRGGGEFELLPEALRPRSGSAEHFAMPPYLGWGRFHDWLDARWKDGEHMAIVGMTGSGKTVLATNIIGIRDFCLVLGTKSRDDSLYEPLEAKGFVRVDSWDPWEWRETGQRKVIFAPPLELADDPSPKEVDQALDAQAAAFRTALIQVFKAGGWCVYADEIAYLTNDLGLTSVFNLLWLQGRSLGISIVGATQRPRSVPLNLFQMSEWFILYRIADREDRKRASELTGPLAPVVFETAARLPRHEFTAVHKADDEIVRSRVQLEAVAA